MRERLHAYFDLLRVIRLPIVLGGFLGYSMGVLLALTGGASFDIPRLTLAYLVVLFGDLSTHYSNDIYDAETDKLSSGKVFGGSNLLAERAMLRPAALTLAFLCSFASIALSMIGVVIFSLPLFFLIITILANLLGWAYSRPPVRLLSRGLGEVSIALGTGFIIPATGYLAATLKLDARLLLLATPFVLYGFVLSLSLELPDLEADLTTGKLNLVARLGRKQTYTMILVLCGLASGLLVIASNSLGRELVAPWMFVAYSVIPLLASMYGYSRGSMEKKVADRISTINIVSLIAMILLVDLSLLGEVFVLRIA